MWVLDVTSDLQIPAFVAVSRRTSGPTEQIMLGFGAHLDPRIAVLRAVTELNQMLTPLLQYPDDRLPGVLSDPDTLRWLNTATLAEQSYLIPHATDSTGLHSYQRPWSDDIRDDVLECQAKVESRGLEMLVLNQTRAEIGMPVVKVIVPGLRHFWSRYAPGRLYDVPVQLGRLPRRLSESELNPIAMFM
jgi:ribosomal protein S12 methylthiotransferase accessory factor